MSNLEEAVAHIEDAIESLITGVASLKESAMLKEEAIESLKNAIDCILLLIDPEDEMQLIQALKDLQDD